MEHVTHNFLPVYNETSRVLILGTFPSVKSREAQFYYAHPQNRFWKVIAALTKSDSYQTILQKKQMLLDNHIAIWDTIASCMIKGSSDASISQVIPTDLSSVIKKSDIHKIYTNGQKAYELYQRYQYPLTKIEAVKLPSTSPANAKYRLEQLIEEWKIIMEK